jgi:plastocyanin
MRRIAFLLLVLACSKPQPAVTVATTGQAKARVIVMTQALVTKESGPPESVKAFGESYAFNPSTFAVRVDEPTQVTFWNLQGDDEHDFMLMDDRNHIVVQRKLPPLSKVTYVMTFHREGVFPFFCTMHQPEMSGQVLVLPPLR